MDNPFSIRNGWFNSIGPMTTQQQEPDPYMEALRASMIDSMGMGTRSREVAVVDIDLGKDIETREVPKEPEKLNAYSAELEEAGFIMAAKATKPLPYPEITIEAIGKLLLKRLPEATFDKKTLSVTVRSGWTNRILQWEETPIQKYAGVPPKHVVESLKRAKGEKVFRSFAVVELIEREEKLPDPLLIGITEDGRRGLIDHWGKDLTIDEIISLVD